MLRSLVRTGAAFALLACAAGCSGSADSTTGDEEDIKNMTHLSGTWGADTAILTAHGDSASIAFGCASASIDSFTIKNGAFTASGTHLAGSGMPFAPGHGPAPAPATFSGQVSGDHLTLHMTESGTTSTFVFTKNRSVNFPRCM
jgi:hypothetical protein